MAMPPIIRADRVYVTDGAGPPEFRPVPSPGTAELQAPVQQLIGERIGRLLEKRGLIERDAENAWLSGDPVPVGSLDHLIGHSINYRIAIGPRVGQKVLTLQTVPTPSRHVRYAPRSRTSTARRTSCSSRWS
jgi:hypothetical protein